MNTLNSTSAVSVRVDGIHHRYAGSVALESISLDIEPGELVALLGPSGCGKTTLLRIVAGLVGQTRGTVRIGNDVVDAMPTNVRGAGIVFQNYALFPHMKVEANVAYGLRARGVSAGEASATARRMLDMVRMSAFGNRYPRELSGGQQQRVALARTLAVKPRVLLLDEPFAALDKNLRLDMQIEIKRIQRELGITTILVTHDQEEAMSMADRIAVMNAGRVEQFDTPEVIYDCPATLFVATFIGTANLLPGNLMARDGFYEVACEGGGALKLGQALPFSEDGRVVVAARPEHLALTTQSDITLSATVEMVLPMGPSFVYELTLSDGRTVKVTQPRIADLPRYAAGDRVGLSLRAGSPAGVFSA
ncbi:ABC transporter ATP-binding protein [Caballeronia mineralivorans]|jgi:putative spermidine/putrescine transport system ATP-binding protein|uniref:ABC transporter ATP-binding protein n=1 Tax=Caballeronia mineralivorans TaxID=2010198 RepID=UPI0023F33423|nr:ABC transporter ATP-binding protein [Caballeronia mineralivorans]MDB5780375.1 transporter ATP-binding protein [Caballeronia mineralivorans]MEA3100855.1 putative spermidine/putrescine transport system ATP-binding protein [Caballeronia mineralivorans]